MVGIKRANNVRQSEGFTAVEALIIIAILGVIGFGGYYVYHAHKDSSNKSPVSSTSNQPKTNASTQSSVSSTIGSFTFSHPNWPAASTDNPGFKNSSSNLMINSPDEQENNGTVTHGATVAVHQQLISAVSYGGSLSSYLENYGPGTPTTTTVAGYSALRLDTKGVVVVAFTKDSYVYSIEEYYPSESTNPYPTVVDDIAASFKRAN